ncbi:unnamed protein product [Gordionus sp. m RMFG-2023]|uniref:probable inactive tRNA-specific adenosine deaminase-like protein 3 isoform X2 n=1 Tax=Gordionus sp. m RMFG-2023 TaxID=3053472 RepID=UPI0030DF8EEA
MNCIESLCQSQRKILDTDYREYYPNNKKICKSYGGTSMTEEQNSSAKFENEMQYLCTNYHLFTTREPCIMCSMALVHARIRRVFYGTESKYGALGSNGVMLHTIKSLNHNFEVYKHLMLEECLALNRF